MRSQGRERNGMDPDQKMRKKEIALARGREEESGRERVAARL